MNYRAFFNGIATETVGAYKVFGISNAEAEELRRIHKGKVSGSNGSYTIFDEAVTYTYVKFYVPELKKMIKINVRDEILECSGLKKISPKFIKNFNENMPKIVYITVEERKWVLEDKTLIEKVIKLAGY